MNINEVIKYPILTEKSYAQIPNNVYAFAVNLRTNRTEVKQAIEFIFQVKVKKVNIINIAKKPTQLGRSKGFTNKVKKAIIIIKEGKINLYPEDAKKDSSKSIEQKQVAPKQQELSQAEQKAAAKIARAAPAPKTSSQAKTVSTPTQETTKQKPLVAKKKLDKSAPLEEKE